MILTQIVGLLAAACTTIAYMPQAVKTIRTKDTSGISLVTYILICSGTVLWLIYGLWIQDVPVIAANAITLPFVSTILFLKLKNK